MGLPIQFTQKIITKSTIGFCRDKVGREQALKNKIRPFFETLSAATKNPEIVTKCV